MKNLFVFSARFTLIVLVAFILAFCYGCQKEAIETENLSEPVFLKSARADNTGANNFMVISRSEALPVGLVEQLSAYGEIVNTIPEIGVVVMKPTSSNFRDKVAKLGNVNSVVPDRELKWIEPDKFMGEANPSSIGDDEDYFFLLWGLDAIDAPEAWDAGYTGTGARVFILDSGIDAEHPDLAQNINTALCKSFVPGEDYNISEIGPNGSPAYFNHGTHVAGIVAAADNSSYTIGVAPDAEIVAVKVISEFTGSASFSWINAGIVYAADNGADVINMSLAATFNRNGFYIEDGVLMKIPASEIVSYILATQRAVNYAFKKGAVVVVAAGNGGSDFDGNGAIYTLPAELQNVIAVSATAPYDWFYNYLRGLPSDLDLVASYTDYGRSLVELAAPGGDFDLNNENVRFDGIISTCPGPSYFWASGTSMASPHVAGVAALIIGKNGGEMDPSAVTKQLFKTSDKIDGNGMSAFYGFGRVNAYRAVTE